MRDPRVCFDKTALVAALDVCEWCDGDAGNFRATRAATHRWTVGSFPVVDWRRQADARTHDARLQSVVESGAGHDCDRGSVDTRPPHLAA